MSVVACISAAGKHTTTFSVSSQVNPTVKRQLKSEGFRLGVDLILKHRNKPDMCSQLFAEYILTVLLPSVDDLRSNEEYKPCGDGDLHWQHIVQRPPRRLCRRWRSYPAWKRTFATHSWQLVCPPKEECLAQARREGSSRACGRK
jgi:hypothetical protein